MKKNIIALVTVFFLLGCESTPHYNRTKVLSLSEGPAAKKAYGSVKLFRDKSEVPTDYETVALMSVEGNAGEEVAFIKAFLYRAADLGADALILERPMVAAGSTVSPFHVAPSQSAVYRGEAIRYMKGKTEPSS